MNAAATYQKQVAGLTVVSGLLALLCLVLLGIALADNPDAYDDPMQLLRMPNLNVDLVRWSMLSDLLGYYLLLLPVIYFLRPYLRERTPWADLITGCATAYVLVGAIGAVVMAEVVCPLLTRYATAPAGQQAHLRTTYQTMNWLVYNGLWNLLETLLAGVWWILTGFVLRTWHKALGWTTLVLGIFTALDALGNLLGWRAVAALGLNGYLLLAPVWAIWLGGLLYQRARPVVTSASQRHGWAIQ